MKKILILLCLLLSNRLFAQETKPLPDVLKSLEQSHPRLLLLKGEEQLIILQTQKYKQWNTIHQGILAECDRIIEEPPVERIKLGKRLLDKSRECLRRVFQLSYAYRTTGNEKYFKRAEKELLAVSAFEDWNPAHFLDVAEMTMAVAIGYDWLFEKLSEENRKIIREAMITKGINPSFDDRFNSFLKADHNWNQVCNAGITFGVLAIAESEPELARKIIARSIGSIPRAMKTSYEPDGAYPEGFSYWEYGTNFNVLFNSVLETALGTDFGLSDAPGFLKTAGFLQNLIGPTGLADNWGDSGLKDGLSPAMFWFADKTKDLSLLWHQKKLLDNPESGYVKNRILPALLVWGIKTDLESIKAPDQKIWVGQGPSPVGLMRTSWTDSNAIFVGFKAGSPSVNHAHMDAGSFVLDAFGERWAMDFGMQDYNSLETKGVDLWNRAQNSQRWQVFRLNNLAHNTLTFDGQLQQVKGYAKVDGWSDMPDEPAIISDLSKIYEGQVASVRRGIAILRKQSVVVRDEVKSLDRPVAMRWNLLTAAAVRIVNDKTVALSQNGKKMLMIIDTQAKIKIKTWSTEPLHEYDAPNPDTQFVGFEASIPAGTEQSFNIHFTNSEQVVSTPALVFWTINKK